MSGDQPEHSPELEQVRRLLFPDLPAAEGWKRIEAAMTAAGDEERIRRIEALADSDLTADLVAALRRLRASAR